MSVELKSITMKEGEKPDDGQKNKVLALSNVGMDNIALDIGDEKDQIKDRLRQRPLNGDGHEDTKKVPKDLDNPDPSYVEPENNSAIKRIQNQIGKFYKKNRTIFKHIFLALLAIGYLVYFAFAMSYEFGSEASIRLLVVTIFVVVFIALRFIWKFVKKPTGRSLQEMKDRISPGVSKAYNKWSHLIIGGAFLIFILVWIIVDVALRMPENLISLTGIAFFFITFFLFSYDPAGVKWRPVFWGLVSQFIFALLILRWSVGFEAFRWIGMRVQEFLDHTDAGSQFVFGDLYTNHFFAFKVLPVIVFFSTMVSVLYYIGVMQFVIKHIARFLAWLLGTSPLESLNTAGNIFIGQSEAPLLIRPFLEKMTRSEMHAVMTGGFATIAGSVLAAYVEFGVPANHLLSASVMSAPAALAMSKLMCPEREMTKAKADQVYNMEKYPARNIIDAASKGASDSIALIANIAVNLIAFLAILHFLDQTLIWMFERVGITEAEYGFTLSLKRLWSYIFWPVAAMMGCSYDDNRRVGELIGTKTFLNEFIAYSDLKVYIENQKNLTWYQNLNGTGNLNITYTGQYSYNGEDIVYHDFNHTLTGGILTDRSVVISTYALCGFSNIGSMGVMLGALGAMAPSRIKDLSELVVTAMISGNVACFMTACIAGLLYEGVPA